MSLPFNSTSNNLQLEEEKINSMTITSLTTSLPDSITLTIDKILPILKDRFLEGIHYTQLSPSILISINPFRNDNKNSDQILNDWREEFMDCGREGIRGSLPNHLWNISSKAYYYMKRSGQDQSIIITGETASGKTESTRLLIKSLIDLSVPPSGKKGSKLFNSIPSAFFILDSFGNASSLSNSNASKFGRYTELQFGDNGKLVGLKGLEYYLETSRVTGASTGERNFHIFHYLLAGADEEERQLMRLNVNEGIQFRYLLSSHRRSSSTLDCNSPDAIRFSQLKEAFKSVGFPRKAIASIFQTLSAILHLGNLEFYSDKSINPDSAIIRNPYLLEIVSDLLGVDARSLEDALTSKSMLLNGESCQVFLDPEGASTNRDEFARALYGLIFTWIGEFINEKLCRDDFSTFIALVDFPGPTQISSGSSRDGCGLEAFAFNLASERLHSFTLEQLFNLNKSEYESQDVTNLLPGLSTPFRSNSEMMRILTNKPGGLIHIIDDQSRRRGKTDETMLKAMGKRWDNHKSFSIRDGDVALGRIGTFTCSHWDAPVTYSAENFLELNSTSISTTFVNLLGGSTPSIGIDGKTTAGARDQLSVGGSSSSFVRQLFASGAVQMRAHPKSQETIVGASTKVGPRRAPSTRRPLKGRNIGGTNSNLNQAEAEEVEEEEEEVEIIKSSKISYDSPSIINEFNESLSVLISTLATTKLWHVLCLRPNEAQLPNQLESKLLKHQIRALSIPELISRLRGEWSVNLSTKEWWERYGKVEPLRGAGSSLNNLMFGDKVFKAREILGWNNRDMAVGKSKVFLSDEAFRYLEDFLRSEDPSELSNSNSNRTLRQPSSSLVHDLYSPYLPLESSMGNYKHSFSKTNSTTGLPFTTSAGEGGRGRGSNSGVLYDEDDFEADYDDRKTGFTDVDSRYDEEERSQVPSDFGLTRLNHNINNKNKQERAMEEEEDLRGIDDRETTVEDIKTSKGRWRWVFLTWLFTWWIPSFLLNWCGGMKRRDVRMAWREKLLINMLIWLLCGAAVFIIAILGNLICPKEYVYSREELSGASLNGNPDQMLVSIRGEAFDLTKFAPVHQPGIAVIPLRSIQRYGGTDATSIFPVQVSALCNGPTGSISPWITLGTSNTTIPNQQYHNFQAWTTDSRPDWYYETMIYLRYNFRKGFIGYTPTEISRLSQAGNTVVILDGGVYDMTNYVANGGGGISVPVGQVPPANLNRAFMSPEVVALFQTRTGSDVTNSIASLGLDPSVLASQKVCLRNLFFIGKVDHRNSVQCQFSRYILLVLSIIMVAIIGFKFIAALQFGRKRKPEDYDKFVICQVPCYTEGEDSLRNCINSLTKLKYDDKRKLLFIICDGMIVGSGNDRPTPRIVLDILGADPTIDPEPLSFLSVGEGNKQHNMAKVYSGLHEFAGHIVPYIVIVKVGKPSERSRPGNRGKRDSQMLLMRFLNRVHFDSPMAPLELEMYHQIKNVIGVNPSFYEYLLMVDADTVVEPFSLNYLVGSFIQDRKVVGLCGETSLSNAKASWTTMMQVYEYFISHYLAKAFESLFGSVTCLPGCFSMYRIRTVEQKPLIIHNNVIKEYGNNRVDTLHVKNLLSLGEDRYLTTVMMKEFPDFKMKFCKDAQAQTIAPDDWKVLMSQRRRWINSTVHNLSELLFVDQMCGFCCFSMRFVVFIDLLSTIIAPVTVAYIGYLIYLVAAEHKAIPTTALIMLGAIYGLQAIIYILHRKFEHIGWMIVYILAIPLFSFVLPLASFWRMDDFSWGSTREIVGERGKRQIIHDEGKFDPESIPLKSWETFENELWEAGSNASIGSLIAGSQRDAAAGAGDSRYGAETPNPRMSGVYGNETPSNRMSGLFNTNFDGQSQFNLNRQSFAGSLDQFAQSYQQQQQPYPHQPYQQQQQQQPPQHARQGSGSNFGQPSPSNSGYFNQFATTRTGSQQDLLNTPSYSPNNPSSNPNRNSVFSNIPRSSSPVPIMRGGLPSDEVIVNHVEELVANSDLNTLSKKGVRQALETRYGCELGDRRGLVNSTIDRILGLDG